jgi:integrase
MPRRGTRKRLGLGLYEDLTGRSAVALGKEKRFPPRTPLAEMRAWQVWIRQSLRGSGRPSAPRGTLADAVDHWASLEQHLASWRERRAELRAWVRLYGDRRLSSLTSDDVRAAMGTWTRDGIAPKTIRNRLWSLKHLYAVIVGPGETPVDHVDPPAKVRTVITPVSPQTILNVYAKLVEFERTGRLRDAKTRARYMVRAATGRRPSEIMRAQPDDVDLGQRTWRVRDGKGGWSEGLYLNDDMLIAWMVFAQADAWGPFATDSMAAVLRAAGWPQGVRPYALRHSVGIEISERGIDLADVGGWLGHTSVQTTRSAYVPILNSRMQRIATAIDGRLAGWTVPSSVPGSDVEIPGKTGKSAAKVLITNKT